MKPDVIAAIAAAGFDVYMRSPLDTWCIFTDGQNLGYLQDSRARGLSLTTVHKPSTYHGTGFHVRESISVDQLTRDTLAKAFIVAPDWAMHKGEVRKYANMADFIKRDSWNASYRLVAGPSFDLMEAV